MTDTNPSLPTETANTSPDASTAAASGCCGGPAPAGATACCARDAEVKATGGAGCGCRTNGARNGCCG